MNIIPILVVVVLGCVGEAEMPSVPPPVKPAESVLIRDFEHLSFERTGCYGSCPSYRFTISSDGRVRYDGRNHVKEIGERAKYLSALQMSDLVAEINRANFFALRSRYARLEDGCDETWTDHPGVIISIRANGLDKTIHHYLGCREDDGESGLGDIYPRVLVSFENRVDSIVRTQEWIGSPEERLRTSPGS